MDGLPERLAQAVHQLHAFAQTGQAIQRQERPREDHRGAQILGLGEDGLGGIAHLAPFGLLDTDHLLGVGVQLARVAGGQTLQLGDAAVLEILSGRGLLADRGKQCVDVDEGHFSERWLRR